MMILTIAFVAYQAKRRSKMSKIKKWGPTIITCIAGDRVVLLLCLLVDSCRFPFICNFFLAAFFVIADPLRTVVLDANIDVCCITEFKGGPCLNAGNNTCATALRSVYSLTPAVLYHVTCSNTQVLHPQPVGFYRPIRRGSLSYRELVR
jgi:hypothetical protein